MSTQSTPPSVDFRNAIIENHWNDPPHTIFNRANGQQVDDSDSRKEIAAAMAAILEHCEPAYKSGPNKRVYTDTAQRISGMLKELEGGEVPQHVVHSLADLSKALEEKEWDTAKEIHTKLMTTEYDKYGGWLLGLKRLIDLYQKASC